MKKWFLILLIAGLSAHAFGQTDTLKLEECLSWAKANFPLLQKQKLQDENLNLQLRNIKSGYLPQLFVSGQATYQSDVPEFESGPFQLDIPMGQYRAAINLEQTIYDGGNSSARKDLAKAEHAALVQQTEVSWQDMEKMVVRVYFAIAIQGRSHDVLKASIEQLQSRLSQMEAMYNAGSVLQSDVLRVKAQLLEIEKQQTQLKLQERATLKSLGILTGKNLERVAEVEIPKAEKSIETHYENLPKIRLMELQKQQLYASEKLASTSLIPKLSAFGTGGIAQPNPYNFFDTDFGTYYMVGVRLHWNLLDWGNTSRTKSGIALQRNIVDTEANQLKQNVQIALADKQSEIYQLEAAAEKDREIAELRESIRKTASKQLDEGTITPADFLETVMDEQRALLSKQLNELKLSKTWVEYLIESGNF